MTNIIVRPLVGMAGVAVLAVLILVFSDAPQKRARDSRRISFVKQMDTAIERYQQDVGMYPDFEMFGLLCQDLKVKNYVAVCPQDSVGGYGYAYRAMPKGFHVWAKLETNATALDSDKDINSTGWRGEISTGEDSSYYYDLGH